jgi:hypothetical protein
VNILAITVQSWHKSDLFLQVLAVAVVGEWVAVWARCSTWQSSHHSRAISHQRQQQAPPITSHLCHVVSWEDTTASADLPLCPANPSSSFCLMAIATLAVPTARETLTQFSSRDSSTHFQHVTLLYTQDRAFTMCLMLLVILPVSCGAWMLASVCSVQKMPCV